MLELERGNFCCSTHPRKACEEADAAFKHAIEIAADQSAKTLELRASIARARLYADQGEGQKAIDMLTPIYSWFAQGVETRDLLQARTLLSQIR